MKKDKREPKSSLVRVENLLAVILLQSMQEASTGERVLALNRVGFSPAEIAELLGERPNTISVQLLRGKQASRSQHYTGRKKRRMPA
jgi:IS30 family transposase